MKKSHHDELQKRLTDINNILKTETLTPEQRKKFEEISDQIAGSLLSSWLPMGTTRKVILFIFLAFAFKYFIESEYLLAVFMVILASLFSPRAMGEVTNFTGKIVGIIGRFFKFFNE